MKTIYLAGLIATDHLETFEWRKEALLELRDLFDVLSPLRGKEQLSTDDGGVTSNMHTNRDIILRDYNDIVKSDVVLVNLETYGSKRALLGTIYELAWAWHRRLPVVAIAAEDNYLMRRHPFVEQTVCHYHLTVKSACRFINEYFI